MALHFYVTLIYVVRIARIVSAVIRLMHLTSLSNKKQSILGVHESISLAAYSVSLSLSSRPAPLSIDHTFPDCGTRLSVAIGRTLSLSLKSPSIIYIYLFNISISLMYSTSKVR